MNVDDNLKALVLFSGGLDSTTTLAIAKAERYDVMALTINYQQRHNFEIKASKKILSKIPNIKHIIFNIDLSKIGGSALTDNQIDVPTNKTSGIPITYVPARNTIFLSIALAKAETVNSFDIFIGVNAIDYSGYPDCRPVFISEFEKLANLATKEAVQNKGSYKIHTPLITLSKAEIIKKGISLKVDYSITSSCYKRNKYGNPCGFCDACILRKKGFENAGFKDPLDYQ